MNKLNPQTDILALDFDGVVVDSIEECLVVGYNALAIQQGRNERIQRLDELPPETVKEARRIRNFIRHGQDYVFIHLGLQEGAKIQNQQDFDCFLEENKTLNADFRRQFYTERARFINEEPDVWLALNPFYPGMQEFLEDFQSKERLYIITTKLKENVQALINTRNINFLSDNILSADQKLSKPQIIARLLSVNRLKPMLFHFIDDQVDTLIKCKSTGVNLYLARWGYNNDNQRAIAQSEELRVLALNEFLRQFRS